MKMMCFVYRQLLRAYPRQFRESYEAEMVRLFRDRGREVARTGGARALARYALLLERSRLRAPQSDLLPGDLSTRASGPECDEYPRRLGPVPHGGPRSGRDSGSIRRPSRSFCPKSSITQSGQVKFGHGPAPLQAPKFLSSRWGAAPCATRKRALETCRLQPAPRAIIVP